MSAGKTEKIKLRRGIKEILFQADVKEVGKVLIFDSSLEQIAFFLALEKERNQE